MKLSAKTFSSIAAILLSTSSFAFSGAFEFNELIGPGVPMQLPTENLYSNVDYQLFCETNDRASKPEGDYSAIQIESNSRHVYVKVDNKDFSSSSLINARIKLSGSIIRIAPITKSQIITITNMDFNTPIHFKCIMEPRQSS